jgi:hypothetical protein
MNDDIFSDGHDALDTSDLDSQWEPDTDTPVDTVAAHDAAVAEEADEVEVEVDDADADEAGVDDEPAGDEDDDKADDAPAIPEHLAGKTPEELARIVQDSQRQIGSQSNEVSQLRKVTEEQAGQIRELIGYLQAAAEPQAPQLDTDSLVAQAIDNPQAAYAQAVRMVDSGHATPDLIEDIIEAVEDMSPKLARQMATDFTRRMVTADVMGRVQQELETTVKPLAKNDYQSQVNLATTSLYNDPELGEDAKAYEKDVVELLRGQHLGNSAQEIRAKLESALTVARGADFTKSPKYKKALEALRVDAQTPGGNPPPAPDAKKSEDDQYRERVFARAGARDPGASLFA